MFKVEWARKLYGERLRSLKELFMVEKPVIGMIHLIPLPGAPGHQGYGMDEIVEHALKDGEALVEGGVDGLIVENMWDLPYYVGKDVPPEEIACQAVAAREVVKEFNVPVGINIVHNGGRATLAVAVASGASFIRVCLLTGALVWDTGEIDHGVAAGLLRLKKNLMCKHIRIFADINKKHAVMFPGIDLQTHAIWTDFYLADALIVTGKMTGLPPNIQDLVAVKETVQERPLLVGSGVNTENVRSFLKVADGVIVGTSLKDGGVAQNPVDKRRVKKLMSIVREERRKITSSRTG